MVARSRFCAAGHGVFASDADLCLECGDRLVDNRVGLVIGDYTCERLIGRGGMSSTVWEASGDEADKVAVKVIEGDLESPEARRLVQSASILYGLNHPNIARIFSYGETDEGEAFIAMELLSGKSLLSVLQHRGALAQKPALHVIRELLSALAFVHERHIIHRDVKPANLYLTPRGGAPWEVRLIDFGIAKQTRERVPDLLELDDDPGAFGPIIGTPEYMAPEQVLGHGADPRSDLYAAGVVLYRLISGNLPFSGPQRRVIYERHLRESAPPLLSALGEPLPDGLIEVVSQALAKNPRDRIQSAAAFLDALEPL